MSGTEARFPIEFESNAGDVAGAASDALGRLREQIRTSEESVKSMSSSLRRLKGSSDEVKAAKDELRAKIEAERSAITASELALVKQGTSYDRVAAAARASASASAKAAGEIDKAKPATDRAAKGAADAKEKALDFAGALEKVGGPAGSVASGVRGLGEQLAKVTSDGAAAGVALAGIALALGVVVGALGSAIERFARFAIVTGNTLRQEGLLREAWTGSAENAKNLGEQIDLLGTKVSTSREKLNELAVGLAKNGVEGQALVDTLNAVGRASDALGDDAGAKLRELVERGRLSQRFVVNPLELQGSGLRFEEIADELAKSMKVGVGEARAALVEGRVKLADGAEALRRAVEAKFGAINAKKLLTIEGLTERLRKSLAGLVSGVNLEPLAKAAEALFSNFDETTVTGYALKKMITDLGTGAASALGGAAPVAKAFIQGLTIGALSLEIVALKLEIQLKRTFGPETWKGLDAAAITLGVMRVALGQVVVGFEIVGRAAVGTLILMQKIGEGVQFVVDGLTGAVAQMVAQIRQLGWTALGGEVVEGFARGIREKVSVAADAVRGLGAGAKAALKEALGIASPSKVFAEFGRQTTAGYVAGVDDTAPDAQRSVDRMVATPAASSSGGRSGGGAAPVIHLEVHVDARGASGGAEIAAALNAPGTLGPLVKALEEALLVIGAAPGGARA